MTAFGLTRRQRQALDFIRDYAAAHGRVSPSMSEIGANMNLGKSSVFRILAALEQRGAIRRLPNRWRSIEVIEKTPPRLVRPISDVAVAVHYPRLLAYCERTGKQPMDVFDDCISRYMEVLELEEKVSALTKSDR